MNVVYIHTHDTGRYLDPRVAPINLPNIGGVAGEAVSFTNAFAAAPTCSPSRSALLTGTSPHVNGMVGLAHRGFSLRDYSLHLNQRFREAGMETALCGVQHVAADKAELRYDRVLDHRQDYFARSGLAPHLWDAENAERAAGYIRQRGEEGTPFFLSYGMLATHRPFPEPSGEPWRHPAPPPPVPNRPGTREDMDRFLRSLRGVDHSVGVVVNALKSAGIWEETVIILTTDHGIAFPRMKATLRDDGIGVGLLLRIPGIADRGRAEEALVSQIDLYPTLCELAGVEVPVAAEGSSLIPLLRGEAKRVREAIFAETNYHAVYEPARAVRTDRYKLVRRYGHGSSPLAANVDDSPSKEFFASAGHFRMPLLAEELFDLYLDPLEERNLAGRPEYRNEYERLADLLESWMVESDDPLLSGEVPRPEGSKLNRRDAYSAEEPTIQ